MERGPGVEPGMLGWKPSALPLGDPRFFEILTVINYFVILTVSYIDSLLTE